MKLSNAQIKTSSDTHMLGTVTLTHKSGEDAAFFVAPVAVPGKVFEETDVEVPGTQFYSTALVSEVAFKDLSQGLKLEGALQGRDLGSFTEHCIRNRR
jgi:hypothetical protein